MPLLYQSQQTPGRGSGSARGPPPCGGDAWWSSLPLLWRWACVSSLLRPYEYIHTNHLGMYMACTRSDLLLQRTPSRHTALWAACSAMTASCSAYMYAHCESILTGHNVTRHGSRYPENRDCNRFWLSRRVQLRFLFGSNSF